MNWNPIMVPATYAPGSPEYVLAHYEVKKHRGKADRCVWGHRSHWYFHWANLTGNYSDIYDYAPMCSTCHAQYDAARRAMESRYDRVHPRWDKFTRMIVRQQLEYALNRNVSYEKTLTVLKLWGDTPIKYAFEEVNTSSYLSMLRTKFNQAHPEMEAEA